MLYQSLLEQLNIIFSVKINHSMLHNPNNGDFPVKTNDFLSNTFSSKWQLRWAVHNNAVVWRTMSNVAEFESNCLRYFSIHDTSNVYFIPHWTVFSYYKCKRTILNAFFIKKTSCSCSMLLRKANPPCYITEQKRNTYVQDLYCNNLTSSPPSSLYCNMRRDMCAISCFQYNKYK